VNTKLKEYVTLQDLEYLDYHSEMVDERDGLMKEYSSDGVHPNEKGYEVMSALAEKMLSGILSQ
jgi:lysophospholipase L1-like esterase